MLYAKRAVRTVWLLRSGSVARRRRRCSLGVFRQLAVLAITMLDELMLTGPSFLPKRCAVKPRHSFRRITYSWAPAQDGCRPSVAVGVARHSALFVGVGKIAFRLSLLYLVVWLAHRATRQRHSSRCLHGLCPFHDSCAQPGARFPST